MTNIISQTVRTLKNWWVFLLSGALMIVASIWVVSEPAESYVALAWLFSILVLANGFAHVIFSISNHKELDGWGWYLAGGILEIFVGIVLVMYPQISLVMLPIFVGFWLMFRGAYIIGNSFELKNYGVEGWGWQLTLGILVIIMAFFMLLDPVFGFFNVVYLTFFGLFFFGVSNIILSFKLKKIKSKTIDKVEDFKKAIKKDLKTLKEDVMEAVKEAAAEEKENVNTAFNEYESKMD